MPLIFLIILAILVVVIRNCTGNDISTPTSTPTNATTSAKSNRGLNRNPSHINYSNHAKCRMDCRHISEKEVQQILKDGKINYSKSDLKASPCNKRYAVEGLTVDKQKVRIIFAPCEAELTVITVIDLEKDWVCNCD